MYLRVVVVPNVSSRGLQGAVGKRAGRKELIGGCDQ